MQGLSRKPGQGQKRLGWTTSGAQESGLRMSDFMASDQSPVIVLETGLIMATRQRVEFQPAYLLHSYPKRETSLIVEVFSREHGRLSLVAKGARRPLSASSARSAQGFSLCPCPGWGGARSRIWCKPNGRAGTFTARRAALLCAYYPASELLLRMLA